MTNFLKFFLKSSLLFLLPSKSRHFSASQDNSSNGLSHLDQHAAAFVVVLQTGTKAVNIEVKQLEQQDHHQNAVKPMNA